jgi:hypothetical protein
LQKRTKYIGVNNMKLSSTYNLKVLAPGVAKQWHPFKNGDLTPVKVTPGSDRKVWWKCGKGHEWQASIANRAGKRRPGCPYCSGRRASKEYNLSITNPGIAKQWHPVKNGKITPDKVTPGSRRKVWWKCGKGHEWQATIASRAGKMSRGCPYCSGKLAGKEYNLSVTNPGIAKQWHPVKNGKITPDKVTPGSDRKVWWKCSKGHEWQTIIASRVKYKSPCPYCSRILPSKEYNLSVTNPELVKYWHPVKNGKLTPDKVTPGSKCKVWWLCENGHEWQAPIYNTIRYKPGCPYCSGRRASKEYNLSVIKPEIAKQWHPVKNGRLKPDKVTPMAGWKVWWRCSKGHEWQAVIGVRVKKNSPCPYCSRRLPGKEYNLLVTKPGIAKQWHPVKNGDLTPGKVTPSSTLKVWWSCDKGHEWQMIVARRIRIGKNTGCPFCRSRRATKDHNVRIHRPDIADQWHPNRNGSTWPEHVSPRSIKKVWWMCDNGHEWEDLVRNRTIHGSGCPYCDKNSYKEYNLLSIYPDIAREWHPTKNSPLEPEDVTPLSGKYVWWMCSKGHEWRIRVMSRNNSGCPYCKGRFPTREHNLLVKYPEVAKLWHPVKNGDLKPDQVTPGSDRKVWWRCKKGHEWKTSIYARTHAKGCPYCSGVRKYRGTLS